MSQPQTVQVVGAGLIGTSIALGLRERGIDVFVDDVDPEHVRVAVDRGAGEAGQALQPDVVIVAVPPAEVPEAVERALAAWPDAVVTDVASVKSDVAAAVSGRDGSDRYVGSHPMSGRERSGPVAASARLFEGAPWVVVPLAETRATAVHTVQWIAEALGAAPRVMDALTHDRAVALVSHVPQVLSVLAAARLQNAPSEHVSLAGPGLRDVTRIASSDPALWTDILSRNAAEVLAVLLAVRDDLSTVIDALENEPSAVAKVLEAGRTGTTTIPGKHGDQAVEWAPVYVVVADRPRELERLVADAGQSGVNIEDLRIQHELGRPAGVVEIYVLPEHADTLVSSLVARDWPAYR
jgi:prephenate dehydrogenase